ncbi:hydrogenase 2 large subunit [Pseudodesulfovibrio sp. JC047]|uniref:nickel-dependent hydrogenase large subunit n=1 Tax=Pseudodesulfovibrio sp. JC047 TaxID=2683199 RepID=UPI0013D72954|nr:nickel-dependent hydrogenase large subunit [Pseudodesulfovibrio sp. JC047]NDV20725.1 hydrogenase 2 large subunit [Pseudodesulfovibrio sp. JC047]
MSGCSPKAAPMAHGKHNVVVDPVTRIEGHLRVEAVVEDGKIVDVRSSSQLFRGLEIILKGRDPRDAQHFTQRSCGVCTYVHALASIRCVDNAVGVDKELPHNATIIRNLVMAAQFMHDHIVHFYHLHALDFVDVAGCLSADVNKTAEIAVAVAKTVRQDPKIVSSKEELQKTKDTVKGIVDSGRLGIFTNAYFLGGHPAYILPPEVNLLATNHYLNALHLQVKAARAMAVFGAKNPHTQFTVMGGVTCYEGLTEKYINDYLALYSDIMDFILDCYIPDLIAVASYYKDWASIGGTTNFMSFGEYPAQGGEADLNSRYVKPGVIMNRDINNVQDFDPKMVEEHVKHSWYKDDSPKHPYSGVTDPMYTSLDDKTKYSWMKAPRYDGKAVEVGPLATCLVNYGKGQPEFVKYVNFVLEKLGVGPEALFSTLGRTGARGIECLVTALKTADWVNDLKENIAKGDMDICKDWDMPAEAQGVGYVNAPRGALSHWMSIKDSKIDNFQLVVPSTWNLGPRCDNDIPGPTEEALLDNTPIADPERPVEILRTVHSYDPCIACGVHVIDNKTGNVKKFRVL